LNKSERLARASRAAEFLRSEAFRESFAELEQQYIESWKSTSPEDWRRREALHAQLLSLHDLRAQLESFVNDGELAKR